MPLDISGLEAAVAQQATTEDSFLAFVQGLKDQLNTELAGNADAQAKVNAVLDQVVANSGKMASAMEQNVP